MTKTQIVVCVTSESISRYVLFFFSVGRASKSCPFQPILVAAAIDYDVQQGKKHGDLTRQISETIMVKRRVYEGLEAPLPTSPIPGNLSRQDQIVRELEGGSVIVGRMTFKEYMEGLRRGWTESPEKIDREDALAHALENDGRFDEIEDESPSSSLDGEPLPTKSRFKAAVFSPLNSFDPNSRPAQQPFTGRSAPVAPPDVIPPQPPLLLVPFLNRIGFKQVPFMIVDFFNERKRVATGAEAAYRLVQNYSRPIIGPSAYSGAPLFSPDEKRPMNDLDFDRENESYYLKSLSSYASDIQKAREEYYGQLHGRLATARALSRGEREPTKDEQANPPPTEVELRADRMKKETRWRDNEEGWEVVRPDKDVAWDDRFGRALKVFEDQPSNANNATSH